MNASPVGAVKAGSLVVPTTSSSIVAVLTAGMDLEHDDAGPSAAVPFIAATALLAAPPLLTYPLFHEPAVSAMPAVQDWTDSHSWPSDFLVCFVFVAIIALG